MAVSLGDSEVKFLDSITQQVKALMLPEAYSWVGIGLVLFASSPNRQMVHPLGPFCYRLWQLLVSLKIK